MDKYNKKEDIPMRYLAIAMLTLSLNALNAGQGVSKPEDAPKQPAKEQVPQRNMVMPDKVDRYDTTDIFAIPADNSETAEDFEMRRLEELSKRVEARRAEQAKQQAKQQTKPTMPE